MTVGIRFITNTSLKWKQRELLHVEPSKWFWSIQYQLCWFSLVPRDFPLKCAQLLYPVRSLIDVFQRSIIQVSHPVIPTRNMFLRPQNFYDIRKIVTEILQTCWWKNTSTWSLQSGQSRVKLHIQAEPQKIAKLIQWQVKKTELFNKLSLWSNRSSGNRHDVWYSNHSFSLKNLVGKIWSPRQFYRSLHHEHVANSVPVLWRQADTDDEVEERIDEHHGGNHTWQTVYECPKRLKHESPIIFFVLYSNASMTCSWDRRKVVKVRRTRRITNWIAKSSTRMLIFLVWTASLPRYRPLFLAFCNSTTSMIVKMTAMMLGMNWNAMVSTMAITNAYWFRSKFCS